MSAHGPKKQYGLDGFAGLVQKTRARSTGTEVGLYAADQAGMESDPETPWCTVCEEHYTLVCQPTLGLARSHASAPEGWCEECQAAKDGSNKTRPLTEESAALLSAIKADLGNWDGMTPVYNHLDAKRRGNLTDLKRRGLVRTETHDGEEWIYLVEASS